MTFSNHFCCFLLCTMWALHKKYDLASYTIYNNCKEYFMMDHLYLQPIISVLNVFVVINNVKFLFIAETLRALALLEDYHAKLSSVPNNDLQVVMQIVIGVFKSRLFQALVGNFIHTTYFKVFQHTHFYK